MRRWIALTAALLMAVSCLCGCGAGGSRYQKNTALDTSEEVHLTIAGSWTSQPGMDLVAAKFHEAYPNCTVEYEYLQDYSENLAKRVASEDDRVDIFTTGNILPDSENRAFALDLAAYQEELPLTDTLQGLTDNYQFVDADGTQHRYAVPLGGEMRGLYVNTTLLSSLGIETPTNRTELLSACAKLKEAGYIALQDNPGTFGQRLLFPYIANLAAGASTSVAACDESAAEVFRDPLEFLYNLTVENYYNYKYVETECERFIDLSNEGVARSFLNITGSDGNYEKKDDIGEVPFMPASNSIMPTIEKTKENYHSEIEYEFILAPVTEDGGYAYISPSNGLAVNKDSYHPDWALEFLNFFFTAENNKVYAEAANLTPNTTDALEIISKKYDVPVEEIGQPEYVTFDGFNFYNLIVPTFVSASKANNPKYMQSDGTMYPFSYYFDSLKDAFAQQNAAMKG